ncbi:hypothetical protein Tco_1266443 [Tanacetum coccineum]
MNELVNDGIKLSKLEINTSFINGLPKKWLSFCQSLRNTNHVKDSELAYLFGKLKYKENLIDSIYETKKNKSLVSATPLLTAFISTSIVKDFQDSPDDEEDTRSNHKYLNDLEEEYQARALLAKSKRFFMKGTQRFGSAKAIDQTECHKYNKKGHFARDCWSKASIPSYQSPFQPKPLSSSQHKPELRPTKNFKAKYNKVKAKMALLSSSASASKAVTIKNKGLIAEAYEWDEEEVSSDDNEMVDVKVLMALAEENDVVSKKGIRNGEWVKISTRKHVNTEILKNNKNLRIELKEITEITETWLNSSNKVNQCVSEQIPSQKKRIMRVDQLTEDPSISGQKDIVFVKSSADDTKVSIPSVERPWLSEAEGFILPNHDTGRILLAESQRNTTGPSVAVTDSSATEYDSMDESLICNTLLPLLKKLDSVEPVSRPNTIKSILKSKSTLKADTFKGVKINEPSSAPAKGNKSSSALKVNSAHAGKLKSVKIKDDPPLAILMKELNDLKLQISKNRSSYSIKRDINPRNSQHVFKRYESCGSSTHTTTDHYDIEWFKRGEALETKKAEALKSTRVESSMLTDPRLLLKVSKATCTNTWYNQDLRWCLEITQHASLKDMVQSKFDEKRGTIFNSNKEIIMIAPKVRDVYVLDMAYFAQESCFFTKAFENLNLDNINIAENERYPPDKYLHPYEPSQRYQTNSNDVFFLEPYECPKPFVLETEVSSDQNGDGMLTRAMAEELGAASAHECLFVDFLSEEEPKKVYEALQHPGWVDPMQDELN